MNRTRPPRIHIGVSVTAPQARSLRIAGPRRDFFALARAVRGRLYVQPPARGRFARQLTPLRQALRIAGRVRRSDAVFADSEHLGIPLLACLVLLARRPARVVILAHLPGRWWKRCALAILTRTGLGGTLLVHSMEQARIVAPWLGGRWRIEVTPYQVDTDFWTSDGTRVPSEVPVVLAVGAEHRDYATLLRAVDGLPVQVVIAAGSHWARGRSEVTSIPANVTYLRETLGFRELREWYRRADIVAVPLVDMPNQFGVTTILEAMSSGLPVVVTATTGQRECIVGPLMRSDGALDREATRDRGPQLFEDASMSGSPTTGVYVPAGDTDALAQAISALARDEALRRELGDAARRVACESFTFERFIARLASTLTGQATEAHVGTAAEVATR